MRTDFIRTILKVAELGNVTKAAEQLFMVGPTVSGQLKIIEEELGFKIFERTGDKTKPILVTDQGAKWLAFARKAVELLDQGAVEIWRAERVKKVKA